MNEASVILDKLTLTEGPRWHDGRFWFSDLFNQRVCSAEEDGSDLRVEAEVPGIPTGLGWLPDDRLLVVIQAEQQVLRREHDGSVVLHADLSEFARGAANDMAVAADGTAYVGSFGFDINNNAPFATAPLMRVTPNGQVSVVVEELAFPNGSVFIDGRTLVVAESFANRLSKFEILPDGTLSPRQDWAVFGPMPSAVELGERFSQLVVAPDGISAPDAEGALWVADFTTNHASRVMPGGEIVDQVSATGDLACFAVALGGADGRTLFLCASPSDAGSDERMKDPGGTVQTYRVDVPLASA